MDTHPAIVVDGMKLIGTDACTTASTTWEAVASYQDANVEVRAEKSDVQSLGGRRRLVQPAAALMPE